MHLKKNKTSVRKIFWALFVVGCGFNVHAVEKTIGVEKTILGKRLYSSREGAEEKDFSGEKESGKKSIDDVNAELIEASEGGNIGELQKLLDFFQEVKPNREGVRRAFTKALDGNNMPIINALLQAKVVHGALDTQDRAPALVRAVDRQPALVRAVGRRDLAPNFVHVLDRQDLAGAFVHAVDKNKEDLAERILEEPYERLVHRYDILNFFKERGESDPFGKSDMYSDRINRYRRPQFVRPNTQLSDMSINSNKIHFLNQTSFYLLTKTNCDHRLLENSHRPQYVLDGPMNISAMQRVELEDMATRITIVKDIISDDRLRPKQHVVETALENLAPWLNIRDLDEIPFPKEVYEKSQTLSARLDQHPLSDEDFKRIMAIRTTDDRNSPFAEYILERFVAGKKGISREMVKTLMISQYFQDAMALMKLRQQGATKVSKLPKGVFRCVLDYDQPGVLKLKTDEGASKK